MFCGQARNRPLIHHTHAAATELFDDAVVRDDFADHDIHKWGNGMLTARRGQSSLIVPRALQHFQRVRQQLRNRIQRLDRASRAL
jgi:hypothetical protein